MEEEIIEIIETKADGIHRVQAVKVLCDNKHANYKVAREATEQFLKFRERARGNRHKEWEQ